MCNCLSGYQCPKCMFPNKPRKHAELIKAWADGAKIQCRGDYSPDWKDVGDICGWYKQTQYRIKPEPKPDSETTTGDSIWNGVTGMRQFVELKYTFDGETGKLKSVEII